MVPSLIFIVPYRNRFHHKTFFENYMKIILEDYDPSSYEIYYVHQCDKRLFNRGAMKNIGFLAMKDKYKDSYKDITFVFNDVDTLPYNKNVLHYETTKGNVKHFYGFKFALGGIFSIKGEDFEKTGGFPNFWSWGLEDNLINNRCIEQNLTVDRSVFYKIGNPNIIQLFDGINRIVSKETHNLAQINNNILKSDNMYSLNNVDYKYNNDFIDVVNFKTLINDKKITYNTFDTRNGIKVNFNNRRGNFNMILN